MTSKKIRSSSLPTVEHLLGLISAAQRPVTLDDLLRMLALNRREKNALLDLLQNLQQSGRLLHQKGGKWLSAGLAKTLQGLVSVQKNGSMFVLPTQSAIQSKPEKTGKNTRPVPVQDIYIAAGQTGEAWHGDLVEVSLFPGKARGKNPEGRITAILNRASKTLTAVVSRRPGAAGPLCRPSDPRFDFFLDTDISALPHKPEAGSLLLVEVGERLAPDLWQAKAKEYMGRHDDVDAHEYLVKINHQIPCDFFPDVEQEARAIAAQDHTQEIALALAEPGRKDMRQTAFVTIDGEDARDFDDAIHVAATPKGWRLQVAIADVSWYVRPGSRLDKEALERGNSYYFPRSVEPMLPPELSNNLCSLQPDEDRLAMVAIMDINPTGQVSHAEFCPAVIRSQARLTYTQVEAFLKGQPFEQPVPPAQQAMLREAENLTRLLNKQRMARGALAMEMPEAAYRFDAEKHLLDIYRAPVLFAHTLIEECMLMANEAVARFLEQKGLPFLRRSHPEPNPERLENLFKTLKLSGIVDNLPPQPDAAAIAPILEAVHGTDQEFLINRLVLRSMMQARYSPESIGHFGLALSHYCHFTSPIRRYADLIVHRALRLALGCGTGAVPQAHKLLAVADSLNQRERKATEAEREITRRLACLMLADKEGQSFSALVSGVTDFGLFVELDQMPVEGMISIRGLGDDWFAYDADRQELVGAGSGTRFVLGQKMTVRLVYVNSERMEVDFALVKAEKLPKAAQLPRKGPSRQKTVAKRSNQQARQKKTEAKHKKRSVKQVRATNKRGR